MKNVRSGTMNFPPPRPMAMQPDRKRCYRPTDRERTGRKCRSATTSAAGIATRQSG